jgi:hypothetical protein
MDIILKDHPRATRLSLRVNPDGRVVLSKGRRVSRARADEFLAANARWIERTRIRLLDFARRFPPFPYPDAAARAGRRRECAERLTAFAAPLLDRYAAQAGGKASRLRIGEFRTQWGSCTADGRIALDWRLALAPPELAEYVVAHEACHLAVPGHPRKFWTLLERLLPGALARRKALRALSRELARH